MSANSSEDERRPSASCLTPHLSSNTSIDNGYFPPFILHPSCVGVCFIHLFFSEATSNLLLQLCFCLLFFFISLMAVLFLLVLSSLNHTHWMIKECSSATALQTNGAYLTIMHNIRADIKYFANCHHGSISFEFFVSFFSDSWMVSGGLDS